MSSPLSQLFVAVRSVSCSDTPRKFPELFPLAGTRSECEGGGVSKVMKVLTGRGLTSARCCFATCLVGTGEEVADEHSRYPPTRPAVLGLGRSREDMEVVVTVIAEILNTNN